MSNNNEINKLVEDTLNSMDEHRNILPAPYLLTRVNARIQEKSSLTFWDKISGIITRPGIAFLCLMIIVIINAFIIMSGDNSSIISSDPVSVESQNLSVANSTLYFDLENLEP